MLFCHYFDVVLKKEAMNAVLNTQRKTTVTFFSASYEPTGVTLLQQLPASYLKLP